MRRRLSYPSRLPRPPRNGVATTREELYALLANRRLERNLSQEDLQQAIYHPGPRIRRLEALDRHLCAESLTDILAALHVGIVLVDLDQVSSGVPVRINLPSCAGSDR
ncbi:MAG: hypothetical protein HXY25_07000 [Alphaproteobacteria bacterium]|nr:hypothetical protein [Alphaproteobacteria bacterium]